jgi:LruC domain-containing protein
MLRLRPRSLLLALALASPSAAAFAAPGDADDDGVADGVDVFPCDGTRASVTYFPDATGSALLSFEDQWPSHTDLDFNDVVVRAHYRMERGVNGNTMSLHASFDPVALGGDLSNGLGLVLPTVRTGVTLARRRINGGSWQNLTLESDGNATLVLSSNLRELFTNASGRINSVPAQARQSGQRLELEVTFASGGASLSVAAAPFDVFIFRSGSSPRHEIHFPQYVGTSSMNTMLFNSEQDRSVLGTRAFVHQSGVPAALNLLSSTRYPNEGVRISDLFPDIALFASSGGAQNQSFFSTNVQAAQGHDVAALAAPTMATPDGACVIDTTPDAFAVSFTGNSYQGDLATSSAFRVTGITQPVSATLGSVMYGGQGCNDWVTAALGVILERSSNSTNGTDGTWAALGSSTVSNNDWLRVRVETLWNGPSYCQTSYSGTVTVGTGTAQSWSRTVLAPSTCGGVALSNTERRVYLRSNGTNNTRCGFTTPCDVAGATAFASQSNIAFVLLDNISTAPAQDGKLDLQSGVKFCSEDAEKNWYPNGLTIRGPNVKIAAVHVRSSFLVTTGLVIPVSGLNVPIQTGVSHGASIDGLDLDNVSIEAHSDRGFGIGSAVTGTVRLNNVTMARKPGSAIFRTGLRFDMQSCGAATMDLTVNASNLTIGGVGYTGAGSAEGPYVQVTPSSCSGTIRFNLSGTNAFSANPGDRIGVGILVQNSGSTVIRANVSGSTTITGADIGVRLFASSTSQLYARLSGLNVTAVNNQTFGEGVRSSVQDSAVLGLTVLNSMLTAAGGTNAARGISSSHSGSSQACLDVVGNTIEMPSGANFGVQVARMDALNAVTVRNRDSLVSNNAITVSGGGTQFSWSNGTLTQTDPCTLP